MSHDTFTLFYHLHFWTLLFRDDLDADEYEETKEDTMEQLKELNDSLNKLVKGDISLVSALGAVQLVTTPNIYIPY